MTESLVVIVTGVSQGLGEAIAYNPAELGIWLAPDAPRSWSGEFLSDDDPQITHHIDRRIYIHEGQTALPGI